jgi:hypothetical protein
LYSLRIACIACGQGNLLFSEKGLSCLFALSQKEADNSGISLLNGMPEQVLYVSSHFFPSLELKEEADFIVLSHYINDLS